MSDPVPDSLSESVRWGVLGTAQFARNRWLPSFVKTPGVRGVAIASRRIDKAREAADRFGFPKASGSYDDLLADPEVEAVYIPLPNGLHGAWSIRAMQAGKHVLVEKPAAASREEALRMRRAARENGVRLMEAFMIRHHPRWQRVRALLDAGSIGAPILAQGAFCFTLADRENVRFDPDLAGGALADVGCYPVHAARFVFGAEPTHAFGLARDVSGTGVDTTFSGGLRFPAGQATFVCSFETGFRQSFTVLGTDGTLSLNRPFICRDEPVTITITDNHGAAREDVLPLGDQYVDEIRHFSACVRDPEKPLWPGEDGVESAAALDALRRSARTGCLEAVEPA